MERGEYRLVRVVTWAELLCQMVFLQSSAGQNPKCQLALLGSLVSCQDRSQLGMARSAGGEEGFTLLVLI